LLEYKVLLFTITLVTLHNFRYYKSIEKHIFKRPLVLEHCAYLKAQRGPSNRRFPPWAIGYEKEINSPLMLGGSRVGYFFFGPVCSIATSKPAKVHAKINASKTDTSTPPFYRGMLTTLEKPILLFFNYTTILIISLGFSSK